MLENAFATCIWLHVFVLTLYTQCKLMHDSSFTFIKYHIECLVGGKFGGFGESSVICQTKIIQIMSQN